mgnify:FL=1|jgi:hypothetical protein
MDPKSNCLNFSLSLPEGQDRNNIPELLRRLATTIDDLDSPIEVQDLVFKNDEFDEACEDESCYLGRVATFTVYYHLAEPEI